jgi:hypothetical protein
MELSTMAASKQTQALKRNVAKTQQPAAGKRG